MTERINLKDLKLNEMEELIVSLGEPKFRAKQIFAWLYKGVDSFDQMTNVPANLKNKLAEAGADLGILKPLKVQVSKLDGTRKYLFELGDGNAIESVFMKYKYGNTICVSSQAGCRMGCKFCASTIGGLCRNLTAGEIIEQLLAAERDTGEPINHIVVMGTGEPFDNYENLSKFISIINDKNGRNLGMRNITVSTCGLAPMIEKFGNDFPQVNLAISLHAPNDAIRSQSMPVNKRWSIDELLKACRDYIDATGRRISFEYAMIDGLNDSDACAEELGNRLRGMLCHVNLIPVNAVEGKKQKRSSKERIRSFMDILEKKGINVTVRRTLGSDINASCGQLRRQQVENQ